MYLKRCCPVKTDKLLGLRQYMMSVETEDQHAEIPEQVCAQVSPLVGVAIYRYRYHTDANSGYIHR